MFMVVEEIFVFGTTNDGFEVYPPRFHKEFTKLDKDREKTFIKQSWLNKSNVLIQYQVGDLISYNNRPGHQFGYCLLTKDRIDQAKYYEAIRYLDGIHDKAFEGHLNIIESGKYKYRRFSEVPKLEEVLNSVKTAINSDTPEFFIKAKGLKTDYISAPFEFDKKDEVKIETEVKDSKAGMVHQAIPDPSKNSHNSALSWKDALLLFSLICGGYSLFLSWNNHNKLNYLEETLSTDLQSKNNQDVPIEKPISFTIEKNNKGKKQIFFDHSTALTSGTLNTQVASRDNFINKIIELSAWPIEITKEFILKNNSDDLQLVEKALKDNSKVTFEEIFKITSASGILIHQED